MRGEHSKRPSATKRGPGRYHREGARKQGLIVRRRKGDFPEALRNFFQNRAAAYAQKRAKAAARQP